MGCGSSQVLPLPFDLSMTATPDATVASPADMSVVDASPALYALAVHVKLTDDGQGVALFTQNGSMVHVPAADIVGKSFVWATVKGGEAVANAKLLEIGAGKVAADLTANFSTEMKYANGPWELAFFISISGADPMKGPQAGDLAAFSLDPPPAGQPKVTGTSVRFTIADANAMLTLTNRFFIRF